MALNGRKFIVVVSGLPRSGTSMMMQMLAAGGMTLITDNIRTADDDNPLGYYEFEPAKRLGIDASWLDSAHDKAVKVIYRLLYDLPRFHFYKVIFMERKLAEVIASQKAMLGRRGTEGSALPDQLLESAFRNDLQKLELWLSGQDNFALHKVNYDDVLHDPENIVGGIAQFLGCRLDLPEMLSVVDRSLYRQRLGAVPGD